MLVENNDYCYPNPTGTDANGGTFSPRKTRLVIEVQIDTRTFYYPITLASVERNTHYSITNLTITRLGSSDPDYPVNSAQITFDLTVEPEPVGDSQPATVIPSKKHPSQHITYRIPAICRVTLDGPYGEVLSLRLPVYQLGLESTYPVYD